jgi:hypothetical protein
MDLIPFTTPTTGGSHFFLLLIDEYTGYMTFAGLANKGSKTIQKAISQLIAEYKAYGHTIKTFTADHESVFKSTELKEFINNSGCHITLTPPYQHQQRIERYVRTINDRVRCIIAGLPYVLPKFLHAELLIAVIQSMNLLPNQHRPNLTPSIMFGAHKMDIARDVHPPFGTIAMFSHAGKDGLDKTQPRTELGIILGSSPTTRGAVRGYIISAKRVKVRHRYQIIQGTPTDLGFQSQQHIGSSLPSFTDLIYIFPETTSTIFADDAIDANLSTPYGNRNPIHETDISRLQGDTCEEHSANPPESQRITHEDDTVSPSAESQKITHEDDTMSPSTEKLELIPEISTELKIQISDKVQQQDMTSDKCRRHPQRNRQLPIKLRNVNHTTIGTINNISVKDALSGSRALESRIAIIEEIKTMISYQVGYYTHWDDISE